jgi:phage terminase large subunit GpA-like protein
VPSGPITRAYEACVDRRLWHVPCPGCGEFSPLDWEQVEWEGRESTDDGELREQRAAFEAGLAHAHYACPHCDRKITDAERWPMIQRGEWVSEGFPRGHHPPAFSVGFQIHGLATPWTSWTTMAAKFVAAKMKGIGELADFHNSDLGVPFWGVSHDETQIVEVRPEALVAKSNEFRRREEPRGLVPAWATHLLGSADPGKTGAHYVIQA